MTANKKKLYGGLLVLAVLIAVVDQFTGEPAVSEAAVIPELNDEFAAPVLEPDAGEVADTEGPLFPFETREVRVQGLRNPFLAPATVRRERDDPVLPTDPVFDPNGPPTVEMFLRGHELTGVMLTPDGGVAIIDDVAVDIGDEVGRAVLLQVGSNEAHFQCVDGVAVLYVNED